MNDQLHAQLSALHDGELSELELRGLLKHLHQCNEVERAEILHKWGRYQVVAEALADEHGSCVASAGFAAAVGRAIEQEPAPAISSVLQQDRAASQAQSESGKVAPLWSRFAVAASVALAVVVGVQQYQLSSTGNEFSVAQGAAAERPAAGTGQAMQLAAAQTASATQQAISAAAGSDNQQQADVLRAQQRLHEYMLEHANHAARQNGQGIAPFARVANFEVDAN
ncbi:MAG: hypothetical protein HKO71_06470 [Pseudomonadales bacterium]|nr:hypothetical protein [Gammaproteobacteria bacterium]NNL57377.1 hypothetical protein [Pseudomonadales bacterium]